MGKSLAAAGQKNSANSSPSHYIVKGYHSPMERDTDPVSSSMHETAKDMEMSVIRDQQPADPAEPDAARKEELRLLKIRKKQELKLVKKFDKSKINMSRECWFLMDSDWLNAWSAFVNGSEVEDPPGPISCKGLLDDKGNPLPNLKAIRDYRGVPPIVYFIFLELYGKDDSPELPRYVVDIYKTPVPVAKMVNIQVTGRVSFLSYKKSEPCVQLAISLRFDMRARAPPSHVPHSPKRRFMSTECGRNGSNGRGNTKTTR